MWVEEEKNKDGKKIYRFREYYYDNLSGKRHSVSVTYARNTKKIQEQALLELNELIAEKQRDEAADMTFGELAEQWLMDYKENVKTNTYLDRKSNIKNMPVRLKNTLLKHLSYSIINKYLRSLKRKGYAKNTIKNYFSTIRNIIAYGLEYGDILDFEMYERIKRPDQKNAPYAFNFLEQTELDSVVKQLRDNGFDEYARFCLLQAYTGTRFGELTGIDYKKNIDFNKKTIFIERSYNSKSDDFDVPKTNQTRTISINDQTIALLKEQIQFTQVKTLAHKLSKTPYLFKYGTGRPLDYGNMNYALRTYVDIEEKNISTHIFRHTFIARAMEQNLPLHLIAKHVGNSTRTIETHYNHFTETMQKQLADEMMKFDFGS